MPAHHATIKNAAKFGIILTGDIESAKAHHTASNTVIEGFDGKVVVAICRIAVRLKAEYPMLEVEFDEDDEQGMFCSDGNPFSYFSLSDPIDVDGAIVDALEAAQEAEIDLNNEDEDDEAEPHNVVPDKYKIEYLARGNRDHCGDWLAQQLDGKFRQINPETNDDMFNHVAFTEMLEANGVEISGKWADLPTSGQKGWIGRYRMNGRQKLEKRLAETGILTIGARKIALPSDYLSALRTKYVLEAEKAPKKVK